MTVGGSKLLTYEIAGLFNVFTALQPHWLEIFVRLDAYVRQGLDAPTQSPVLMDIISRTKLIVNSTINKKFCEVFILAIVLCVVPIVRWLKIPHEGDVYYSANVPTDMVMRRIPLLIDFSLFILAFKISPVW